MAESERKDMAAPWELILFSKTVHVLHRFPDGNGKTGAFRMAAHEAHSLASKMESAYPRIPGKVHSNSDLSPPSPSVVATGTKCPPGTALTPFTTCSSNIYQRLKRTLECSLNGLYHKRFMVTSRKQAAHKHVRAKGCFVDAKGVLRCLLW